MPAPDGADTLNPASCQASRRGAQPYHWKRDLEPTTTCWLGGDSPSRKSLRSLRRSCGPNRGYDQSVGHHAQHKKGIEIKLAAITGRFRSRKPQGGYFKAASMPSACDRVSSHAQLHFQPLKEAVPAKSSARMHMMDAARIRLV